MARKKQKPLSAEEIRFAERCLEHGNATRAFRELGFAARVKESSVRELASRLRAKPAVDKYISGLSKALQEACRVRMREDMLARM
jgi:hypothetical protein